MAARKPKAQKVVPSSQANVVPVPELTAQECHNIIQLLNRVETKGINEAVVLGHTAHRS